MHISIESPTKAFLIDYLPEELDLLREYLTFSHTGNAYLLKRHMDNFWFRSKNPEAWEARRDEIKAKLKFTLVFTDTDGRLFIRPGSIPYLPKSLSIRVDSHIKYPAPKKVAWTKELPFELYPYQESSWSKLLSEKHGNVELCTGAGKTAILLKLCREFGLKTAIITPSKSIFLEVLKQFEHHFGKANVGTFGNGKKKIGKRFTICINDSLVNVKPGTEEWDFFSNINAVIFDESHLLASETLEEVCHGVFGEVPYRWFLSGTQVRGDGTLKLLQSIIGQTVCSLSTADAVKGGYICYHDYTMVDVETANPNLNPRDPLECKRVHFLRNRNIGNFIAKFCNTIVPKTGQQVLVLVDELEQIAFLAKSLNVPFAYAHSESKKDRLAELGLEKVNSEESVERFNKNEVKVLIGSSAISTGTNIFANHYTFGWIGGSSEIRTRQGTVGRSVRKLSSSPWADKCVPKPKATIFDFRVTDVPLMVKHLEDRLEYYKESGTEIRFVKIS